LTASFAGLALQAQIPEPKANVINNVFTCVGTPKLTFKVQPEFSYLGHVQDFEEAINSDPGGDSSKTGHWQCDSYLFADQADPASPKVFVLGIYRMNAHGWYFFDNLHERLPEDRYLEKGRFKLGDTNFRTATFTGNVFTPKQLSFLIDHDIHVPRQFTTRQVEGTVTVNSAVKVSFTYAQDIPGLNRRFLTLTSLGKEEQQKLNAFTASANSFFDAH
jgi:hypothetical protein